MKGDKEEVGAIIQRDKETFAVAPHIPCGVIAPETLRKIAEVGEKYNCAALKITSAARIAMVGLKEEDLENVWADLGMAPGAAIGLCVRSVKACPGTTFCKRGQQDSLTMGMKLDEKFHGMQLPAKLKMAASGCPNQCAENAIKDISLMGTTKGWRVLVGGCGGAKPRLAERIAEGLGDDDALAMIDAIVEYFKANAKPKERLGWTINRLGMEHLTQAVGIA